MCTLLKHAFVLRLVGLMVAATACIAALPPSRAQPLSPCLSAPGDYVGFLRTQVDMLFDPTEVDSADNLAHGIPYATGTNVVLVTADSLCSEVIAAHNVLPDSERIGTTALTQAFVFDLNGTGFALADTSMTTLVMLKADLSFFRAWKI